MFVEEKDPIKKISHKDIADFFLALANETGDPVTNLKLQKLVYYAQAWHLANFDEPLFDDVEFQAWVHGPVIPELYEQYKEFGSETIRSDVTLSDVANELDAGTLEFLNEVATVYMPRGAYELELMTHREDPWVKARGTLALDERSDSIISREEMKSFYGEKIKDQGD